MRFGAGSPSMALQSSQVCDGPLPLALRPCSPTTYVTRPWLLWCTSTGDGKASGDPSLRAGRAQSGRTRTGQAVPTPTPAADCDPCDRSRDDMTKHDVSATTALLLLPLGESALWHSAVPSPAAILRGNRYVSRGRDACAGTGEEARLGQLTAPIMAGRGFLSVQVRRRGAAFCGRGCRPTLYGNPRLRGTIA